MNDSQQKPRRVAWIAVMMLAVGCTKEVPNADVSPAASAVVTSDSTVPATKPPPAAKPLPAAEPPSLPDRAAEVPDLEQKLAAIKEYAGIWAPERRDDRTLLLSGVSELLTAGAFYGPVRTTIDAKKPLREAAIKLYLIFARLGRYPDGFTAELAKHLDAVKSEPHLGVWSPEQKGRVPHDFSALAYWMNRDRPEYLREMLAARREGPLHWLDPDPKKPPERPYLADEKAAIERLAQLAPLAPAEQARLDQLRADAAVMRVPIEKLLGEYKDNEVRADGQFKGQLVQVTGVVGDVKKNVTDSIYVTVGTGQQFEIPEVQCFVADGQEKRAAALSKGAKVTVRGRVDGLMMNVLVRDCEITP